MLLSSPSVLLTLSLSVVLLWNNQDIQIVDRCMASTSAAVILTDTLYSLEGMVDGFSMFRPPRRAGRANKFLVK